MGGQNDLRWERCHRCHNRDLALLAAGVLDGHPPGCDGVRWYCFNCNYAELQPGTEFTGWECRDVTVRVREMPLTTSGP